MDDSLVARFLVTLWSQTHWSKRTFGPGLRTKGLIEHIESELAEVADKPLDVEEWVDVMILAFDGAWRTGYSPEEIIEAYEKKMAKNFLRKWPDWQSIENSDGHALMHIKDESEEIDEMVARVQEMPPVAGGTITLNITDAQAREMSGAEIRARTARLHGGSL